MRGPLLRFAVVAILLLVLVVFYATRLGDEPDAEPEDVPVSMGEIGPGASGALEAGRPPSGDKKEDWFPDLSDRNDIPGVTLGVTAERTSFGCDVQALASKLGDSLSGDDKAQFLAYVNMLSASGNAEHQLAALQLLQAEGGGITDDGTGTSLPQVDHLALALKADPMNPLVLWNAAGACSDPDLHSFCTDPNVQANMRTMLGSNGEYWAQEAARLYVVGDLDGSLDALRRSASAPVFDSYFAEHVRMHERALSLISDFGPVERSLGAYALSLTNVSGSARGLTPCVIEDDPSWFEPCTAVANRMASESPTIMQRGLGMEMLARIYESGGQAEAAELERTRATELARSFWAQDEDLIAVMVTDERVLSLYLEELEAGDEVMAVQFLSDEVERLKQDPDYSPCPAEAGDE